MRGFEIIRRFRKTAGVKKVIGLASSLFSVVSLVIASITILRRLLTFWFNNDFGIWLRRTLIVSSSLLREGASGNEARYHDRHHLSLKVCHIKCLLRANSAPMGGRRVAPANKR